MSGPFPQTKLLASPPFPVLFSTLPKNPACSVQQQTPGKANGENNSNQQPPKCPKICSNNPPKRRTPQTSHQFSPYHPYPLILSPGALSKMFSMDDVAKSGIVVLPCGAGKTLVGIAACCRVGRRALVLTTTAVAVDQWRRQLQLYTTLPPVRWQLKRISGGFHQQKWW